MDNNRREFSAIERGVIIKLFHNKVLHPYLEDLLPGIFTNKLLRCIAFAMKSLHKQKSKLDIDSLSIFVGSSNELRTFERKHQAEITTSQDLVFVLIDEAIGLDTSPKLFREAYAQLVESSFKNFSRRMADDIKYYTEKFGQEASILTCSSSINKVHNLLYKRKFKNYNDQIGDAANQINLTTNFIPSFSTELNNAILGFSKAYPASMLARSQHCKSTFISNQARFLIRKKITDKVAIISTEEQSTDFWQRMYALDCKFSIHGMRSGVVKIGNEHVQILKDLYENRIMFYNQIKYRDVVDLLFTLDAEFIIIDHINSIQYEGGGDAIHNMIGGIPNLITMEKNFLDINRDTVILNLNQVREKNIENEIKHKWKRPNYGMAFASSITYVAAREWITLYYPYKDVINRPREWTGSKNIPTENELYVYVEKNSFGGNLGEHKLRLIPDLALIEDANLSKVDFTPPKKLTKKEEELGWNMF